MREGVTGITKVVGTEIDRENCCNNLQYFAGGLEKAPIDQCQQQRGRNW